MLKKPLLLAHAICELNEHVLFFKNYVMSPLIFIIVSK
jgi:hypothetical protein